MPDNTIPPGTPSNNSITVRAPRTEAEEIADWLAANSKNLTDEEKAEFGELVVRENPDSTGLTLHTSPEQFARNARALSLTPDLYAQISTDTVMLNDHLAAKNPVAEADLARLFKRYGSKKNAGDFAELLGRAYETYKNANGLKILAAEPVIAPLSLNGFVRILLAYEEANRDVKKLSISEAVRDLLKNPDAYGNHLPGARLKEAAQTGSTAGIREEINAELLRRRVISGFEGLIGDHENGYKKLDDVIRNIKSTVIKELVSDKTSKLSVDELVQLGTIAAERGKTVDNIIESEVRITDLQILQILDKYSEKISANGRLLNLDVAIAEISAKPLQWYGLVEKNSK